MMASTASALEHHATLLHIHLRVAQCEQGFMKGIAVHVLRETSIRSCRGLCGSNHHWAVRPKDARASSCCAPVFKKCIALPAKSLAHLMSVAGTQVHPTRLQEMESRAIYTA